MLVQPIDMRSMRFGMLIVTEYSHANDGAWWKCICDCGNITIKSGAALRRGAKARNGFSSCGCVKSSLEITGDKKKCNGCFLYLPLEAFAKMTSMKHGRQPKCRSCTKKWRTKNRSWLLKRKREYNYTHRDEIAIKVKARRALPEFKAANSRRSTEWRLKNPERRREIALSWVKRNKDYACFISSLRRARKLQATPKWANLDKILEIYKEASSRRMHVDHIVPLAHPRVCGLHVEWNLSILTPLENFKKNNRWP